MAELLCVTTGKIIYPTHKAAMIAAGQFKRLPKSKHHFGRNTMVAYECRDCEGFHLGHRKEQGDSRPWRQKTKTKKAASSRRQIGWRIKQRQRGRYREE